MIVMSKLWEASTASGRGAKTKIEAPTRKEAIEIAERIGYVDFQLIELEEPGI